MKYTKQQVDCDNAPSITVYISNYLPYLFTQSAVAVFFAHLQEKLLVINQLLFDAFRKLLKSASLLSQPILSQCTFLFHYNKTKLNENKNYHVFQWNAQKKFFKLLL